MAPAAQEPRDDEPGVTPDFVLLGHATRDLLPDGSWRLGGTVTFAALTAQRLGVGRVGIVTSGAEDVLAALRDMLPSAATVVVPAPEATTYENIYAPTGRQQYLRGRAATLSLAAVPPLWLRASVVLLAPLANEVDPRLGAAFAGALVGATPQGWLRRFRDDGRVSAGPLDVLDGLPANLRVLILSVEDLQEVAVRKDPAQREGVGGGQEITAAVEQARHWTERVPYVVLTLGQRGALLLSAGQPDVLLPGYPAEEVDPTGAGDVFAAAFLCELRATGDAKAAVDFANRVAALSVEGPGATRIPSRAEVAARFG